MSSESLSDLKFRHENGGTHHTASARYVAALETALADVTTWRPVTDLPEHHRKLVTLHIPEWPFVVTGCYMRQFELEADDDYGNDPSWGDYDEKIDEYYYHEGWYAIYHSDTFDFIYRNVNPNGWLPLPAYTEAAP